jgi:hypothetical protein
LMILPLRQLAAWAACRRAGCAGCIRPKRNSGSFSNNGRRPRRQRHSAVRHHGEGRSSRRCCSSGRCPPLAGTPPIMSNSCCQRPERAVPRLFQFATGTCPPPPPCGLGAARDAGGRGPFKRAWTVTLLRRSDRRHAREACFVLALQNVMQTHAAHHASQVHLRASWAAREACCAKAWLRRTCRWRLSCCKAACAEASVRASCHRRCRRPPPCTCFRQPAARWWAAQA